MSWVALGVAAVGAVGTVVSSKDAKKNAGATAAPVDIGQVTGDTAQANLNNEGSIEELLRQSNAFQQGQRTDLLNQAIPGYSNIAGSLSATAQQEAANPYALPQDMTDNLTRLAAERGINTGVRGQAGDYSLLRDFGVNELQYGQQNLQNSQSILSTLANVGAVNPLSPLSFYATPGQSLSAATGNQNLAQSGINAQNAANQYATANTWAGVSKLAGTIGGMTSNSNNNFASTTGSGLLNQNGGGFVDNYSGIPAGGGSAGYSY